MKKEYLSEPEAALYLGISLSSLKRKRLNGEGPAYLRLSERMVRYFQEDLDAYIASCRVIPKR